MEPETHRRDREAMLAERQSLAERLRREVDELVAAAAQKRRVHFDRFLERMRAESAEGGPADVHAARLLVAAANAAEDVREASRARALQTLTEAGEQATKIGAEVERERAALAEVLERRAQAGREAEEILASAHSEADRVLTAAAAERRGHVEKETEELTALRAEMERERAAIAETQERRRQAESEAEEILARARAEADRAVIEVAEERRRQAEREADEILARARVEADQVVAAIEEERRRVRDLLSGAIASLDVEGAADSESIVGDLSSRVLETRESSGT